MNRNNIYILEDRGLLYINGDDAKEFLQNIITNDVNKVSRSQTIFSGIFTPATRAISFSFNLAFVYV